MDTLTDLQTAFFCAIDTQAAIFDALESAKKAPVLNASLLVTLEEAHAIASKNYIAKEKALQDFKKAQLGIAEKIARIEDARVTIFGAQEALRTAGELTDAQKNSARHALTALRLEFNL